MVVLTPRHHQFFYYKILHRRTMGIIVNWGNIIPFLPLLHPLNVLPIFPFFPLSISKSTKIKALIFSACLETEKMSISISSLASSLSSLSFSSQISQKPNTLSFSRSKSLSLSLSPYSNSNKQPFTLRVTATVASPETTTTDLKKLVKSRLPGGFAAQPIHGTGRRKCAIARVVLQEGTGKVIINYRDAKVNANSPSFLTFSFTFMGTVVFWVVDCSWYSHFILCFLSDCSHTEMGFADFILKLPYLLSEKYLLCGKITWHKLFYEQWLDFMLAFLISWWKNECFMLIVTILGAYFSKDQLLVLFLAIGFWMEKERLYLSVI